MHVLRALGALLFDPRGRMSRQDMLAAAAIVLALDMGVAGMAEGAAALAVKGVAYWIGCAGIVKRLHDAGQSGWWLPGGAAALCAWSAVVGVAVALTIGFESLQPGGVGHILLVAALMIPALGATLWLHLAAGEPGVNRYGAPPEGLAALLADRRRNDAATVADL